MFVMESPENADIFKKQKKLIVDLLGRLDCVNANSVRVGCINTEAQWFGLTTFQEKADVICAIGELGYTGSGPPGNLEKSLETMRQVMTSEARKDVSNRMAIVLRSQPTDLATKKSPTRRKASVANNSDTRRPSIVVNPANRRPSIAVNPANRRPSIAVNPAKQAPLDVVNPANRRPSISVNPAKQAPLDVVNPANRRPSIAVNPAKRPPLDAVNPANRRPSIAVNPANRRPSIDVNSRRKPSVTVNTVGMLTIGNVNSNRLSVPGAVSSRRSSVNAGIDPSDKETGGDDDEVSANVTIDPTSKVSPETDRLIRECQLAKDADIRLIVVGEYTGKTRGRNSHLANSQIPEDAPHLRFTLNSIVVIIIIILLLVILN